VTDALTGPDTVVVVPILRRHHRVRPVAESIRASCDARVLFVVTPGDVDVIREVEAVEHLAEYLTVPWVPVGDYARKINAGIRASTEPLIFMGADDLEFEPGWLDKAKARLGPGIGVVGTNDLGNPRVLAGEHATHSLITRVYVDTHGTIDGPGDALYEGYPHEYCDDELVGTAKARGAWAYAADAIVRHRHPNWDTTVPMDALYAGQGRRMAAGRGLFQRRRLRWT
jgi:hypothetical protein